MEKIIKSILIFALSCPLYAMASNISFMIKDDEVTESYLKLKNSKDDAYLMFYCNNFYNDIKVSIEGLNEKDFFEKNYYVSKTIFGKDFSKSTWKVTYDENGNFHLLLDEQGINFVQKFHKEGKVLIDMPELDGIKLYNIKNKNVMQKRISSVFENCSIYF